MDVSLFMAAKLCELYHVGDTVPGLAKCEAYVCIIHVYVYVYACAYA